VLKSKKLNSADSDLRNYVVFLPVVRKYIDYRGGHQLPSLHVQHLPVHIEDQAQDLNKNLSTPQGMIIFHWMMQFATNL